MEASNFLAEASIFSTVSSKVALAPRWKRRGLMRATTKALRYGLTNPRSLSAFTAATTASSSSSIALARSSRVTSAAGSFEARKASTRRSIGA